MRIFIYFYLFIISLNSYTQTLQSCIVYSWTLPEAANVLIPFHSSQELKDFTIKKIDDKYVVIDTVLNERILNDIHAMCCANRRLKKIITEENSFFFLKKKGILFITTVLELNYSRKIITIGFSKCGRMIVDDKIIFKIDDSLYLYVFNNIVLVQSNIKWTNN